MSPRLPILLVLALGAAAGCASETDDPPACVGAKCDDPGGGDDVYGEHGQQCRLRRLDAFNDNQRAYTKTALRWSCQDTPGINGIDRGQEYCEYFTIVQLPPEEAGGQAPDPAVLGRLIRIENDDPDDPNAESFDQTPIGVDLTANQVAELDAAPDQVVAQCVFSSWNVDYEEPPPACDGAGGCPEVMGLTVEPENFRMKLDANSTDAAQALTEDCWDNELGDNELAAPEDASDPGNDDFFRGCMVNAEVNGTSYRKSDSTICPAINRLAECGCDVVDPDITLADAISPWERRGFPLGTWSSPTELPAGCRYVELGDDSHTLVSCDLTAGDILTYASDPKALCREKYGPNVVVHVPIDPAAIRCDPASSDSQWADSCSATPWIVEPGELDF